ncbi:hypothetical protein C8R46DRAFT_1226529 [Mycena filopes]|nr:hypothetical protein C8R46DRAFT_1226529 [Mycena filopes]
MDPTAKTSQGLVNVAGTLRNALRTASLSLSTFAVFLTETASSSSVTALGTKEGLMSVATGLLRLQNTLEAGSNGVAEIQALLVIESQRRRAAETLLQQEQERSERIEKRLHAAAQVEMWHDVTAQAITQLRRIENTMQAARDLPDEPERRAHCRSPSQSDDGPPTKRARHEETPSDPILDGNSCSPRKSRESSLDSSRPNSPWPAFPHSFDPLPARAEARNLNPSRVVSEFLSSLQNEEDTFQPSVERPSNPTPRFFNEAPQPSSETSAETLFGNTPLSMHTETPPHTSNSLQPSFQASLPRPALNTLNFNELRSSVVYTLPEPHHPNQNWKEDLKYHCICGARFASDAAVEAHFSMFDSGEPPVE